MAFRPDLMATMLEDNPKMLGENLQSEYQNSTILANKSLVGKIRVNKTLNIKATLDIINKAWANYPGLQISEHGKNIFLFSFAKEEDKIDVLKRAHWFIMNQLLCIEEWLPHVLTKR